MAATGSGDGLPLATNQVPSVQVPDAVKGVMEAMEAVSEWDEKVNPKLVRGSPPRQSLRGEQDKCIAGKNKMEKTQHEETKEAFLPSPASVSPQNLSFSTDQTFRTVLVHGVAQGSTSESRDERSVVKTEEKLDISEQNVVVKHNCSEQGPIGSDVGEDSDMDTINHSDFKKEITNTDCSVDQDTDPKEDVGTEQDNESQDCKSMGSTEDDLDEKMDIGAVDQVEQEALMINEEKRSSLDVECSISPGTLTTVLMAEEETDAKPTILSPQVLEDQVRDVRVPLDLISSSSSPSCVATASAGRDGSSPATLMNGRKVVKLSIPRLDTAKLGTDQSIRLSPSSPLVKVKDEPEDEEYEQALISSTFTASVKDEPHFTEEDLRIGSVFSVTPTETQTLPTVYPSSLHMSCSHCKKSLKKGQTAFQRKGSPALFCSPYCLTSYISTLKGVINICFNCQKMIPRPQDVILSPDARGAMKEFCSQNCLTYFNYRKNYMRTENPFKQSQAMGPQSLCSMCKRYGISKHEVILGGQVNKLCSDACFSRFRTSHNLSMAGCANCGSYCHSKPLVLKMEECNKTLCDTKCLTNYKEKTKISQPCTMCRTTHLLVEMLDNKNLDNSVNLFCSSSCVMAFKVQTVSASGARLNCDSCGKNTVPAYHLAMSDTSIRNFCTLPCVMNFQEKFKRSQKQVNVFTKLPVGSSEVQTVTLTQPQQDFTKSLPRLDCCQCTSSITFQPELIQIKDKMAFVCNVDCSHDYKRVNSVMSLCEYCKVEKITRDARRINNRDCYFCSDGCKLLYRHDLSKNWGKHCHSCVYCHCVSKKLVTAQYGGSTEEFCSEECRSKYTMLFCHVAKCDTCGCKGKLKQSLPMLGEVKHFCDLSCLLQFCSDKMATQGEIFRGKETTPVIGNVISLAGPQAAKYNFIGSTERTVQQSTTTKVQSKNSGQVSCRLLNTIGIQTEPIKPHPPPAPKILKNKALLCRPLVQNKGISCKAQTADVESQTDDVFPKMMIVPVPVPVYIPVPMNMYSQCTPNPVCLPLPLPVPMFLPVTMDSAERIVETIQEIKEKIPSDPFEAELILMAEMVAEQDRDNSKEERPKDKGAEKKTERHEAPAPDDLTSNYSDDLDTEDLASFLSNWEDTSESGFRSPNQSLVQEKLSLGMPSEPDSELPPPAPPPMDVEADLSVEILESMAQLREECQQTQSLPPSAPRRKQAHRKAREKRGRKSKRWSKAAEVANQRESSKAVAPEIPKLKSQYGVDAWKRWIQWRRSQPNLEKPRFGSRPVELKEDVLQCTTAELSYGLCCFITEVKRPNGELYSPDSLFYLCLGIQQHLFEKGRAENIFMDRFYHKFSTVFTSLLRGFTPAISASGYIHSLVEEDFLWDCKQLGAYSPVVLLNTLLFFGCKYFGFTTVEHHRQLSFAHVMRCTKTNPDNTKTTFLRFYPPLSVNEEEPDLEVPAKKRREEESKGDIFEMVENTENPLRCPVRLYEFYLSKCSESVKQRTNLFYLLPERCCVPNSPLWFSSTTLDESTMEAMLSRILTVRELHLGKRKEPDVPSDPPFISKPEESGDLE